MILFLEIIIGLGLIAFPIVLSILNGTITFTTYCGIVLGIHYDKIHIKEDYKDGSPAQTFRINMIQFHLFFITILMSFRTKYNGEYTE